MQAEKGDELQPHCASCSAQSESRHLSSGSEPSCYVAYGTACIRERAGCRWLKLLLTDRMDRMLL